MVDRAIRWCGRCGGNTDQWRERAWWEGRGAVGLVLALLTWPWAGWTCEVCEGPPPIGSNE